jgi:hypothetical protein
MATPTVNELIERIERISLQSDDTLARVISRTQREIYTEIIQILRSFQDSGFRLTSDAKDITLYYELRRKINRIFRESNYSSALDAYLTTFDEVEPLTKQIIATGADRSTQRAIFGVSTAVEREMIAGGIANTLISPTSIENTFIAPLQRMIYTNVQGRVTYNEAERVLRQYLLDTPGKQTGFIRRYVTQITRDGLNQFQGAVNQKMVKEVGLDGFQYVGSLLQDDSRQNCIELVNGSGAFAPYHLGNRLYRIEDLPAIIAIAEQRPGWIPGTTPATFFINRGGYNCRHRAIARKLPKQ